MPRVKKNEKGCSVDAFFRAVASGHLWSVKNLAYSEEHLLANRTYSPPALKIFIGNAYPLHVAAQLGYSDIVSFLLSELEAIGKADSINWEDRFGKTPIDHAVEEGHKDTVLILLKKEANIKERNFNAYPPLILAILYGKEDIVGLLLSAGANPNVRAGSSKDTALHFAVKSKEPCAKNIILLLLCYGADTQLKNGELIREGALGFNTNGYYNGKKPDEMAMAQSDFETAHLIRSYAHIKQSVFNLLKYARLLSITKGNNYFKTLPIDLYRQILALSTEASPNLSPEQVNAIVKYAADKKTIGKTKKEFTENTIFTFFKSNNANINKSSHKENKLECGTTHSVNRYK